MNCHNENKEHFPPHSAGRLAETAVPVVSRHDTIGDVARYLKKNIREFESINYIYVTNKDGGLIGILSIKDILRQPADMKVETAMRTDFIKAHPFTDQEKVAFLALRNNIKAVPIVDKSGIFIGAVLNDTILSVLHEEAQEDFAHQSGVIRFAPGQTVLNMPVLTVIKHRLPWLFFGLVGILLAAKIIGYFESTLEGNLILASFIPMIMYMGGSTLSQTQAFFIRDLALSQKLPFFKYFARQSAITFLISFILSVLTYFISDMLINDPKISMVISVALFAVLCLTTFTSLLFPYVFYKLKKDPADGSGPLSTIIQDVSGVIVYFLIASLLLI